jgi:Icc-related predicted phosphoesterase
MTGTPSGTPLDVVRIAAVGDLHYSRQQPGALPRTLAAIGAEADVLVLCGDLTDYGLPDEARGLGRELSQALKIPIIAVLGNHDYEAGHPAEVRDLLRESGVVVLDGDAHEVHGIGFAGVKGFGGGFGARALSAWGEPAIKLFVQEAVNEALKLETALARVRTRVRLAVLHYSPICETVSGEPEDVFPFLGSSRLEEPINRYEVAAVFHGHAHRGRPEGHTATGVPVYNVSLPVLSRQPSDKPFRVFEFRPGPADAAADTSPSAH